MKAHRLNISRLKGTYAICRLPHSARIPRWAGGSHFVNICRTASELSIVCEQGKVPRSTQADRGWICLRVDGTMDLALIGVMASITVPLAAKGVSLFTLATYDTDYFLVRKKDLAKALRALSGAGHRCLSG